MAAKKTRAQSVAESQAETLRRGGERLTLMLTPADADLWRRLVARQSGEHGAKMRAFREALRAAHASVANEPTDAELLRMVGERMDARHR